jgi:hypothetical protein
MSKTFPTTVKVIALFVVIFSFGFILGCGREQPPAPQPAQAPVATAPQPAVSQPAAQQQAPAPTATQAQPVAPAVSAGPPAATALPSQQPASAPTQPAPASAVQPGMPATSGAAPATMGGQQSFSQVQVGMTSQEVMQILGNPSRVKQERQYVEWEYYTPQGKFEVKFQGDRVAYISRH